MDAVLTSTRNLLRQDALERRKSLSCADVDRWSRSIQAKVLALDCYKTADLVALYSPVQNEVDTWDLLDDALASGKKVFLPRWVKPAFGFAQITSRSQLAAGRFGIPEPIEAMSLAHSDKQKLLVFVPGLVFDTRGNRLGRGGGTYDQLLGKLSGSARFVGLAYEFQIIDVVPAQYWDCAMHFIVTEQRTIDCGSDLRRASEGSTAN